MTSFEARLFGDTHQAAFLAGWCDGTVAGLSILPGSVAGGSKIHAEPGDWIIRAADGTVRIEKAGSQDGYCADCGLPVWWQDERLVSRRGERWCYGKDEAHFGMTYHHALPGMAQYVVQAPEGQVCYCLARPGPHIHQIIMVSS